MEAGSFKSAPPLHTKWKKELPRDLRFLTDRYWMFPQDPHREAANSVGKLLLGITCSYSEFREVGSDIKGGWITRDGNTRDVSFLTLIAMTGARILNAERTATSLIEVANERLLALNSPYHLPL